MLGTGSLESRRARWIRGPWRDGAAALLWVPFALAAHWLEADREALNLLLGGVLLLSFSHQPLTLAFVYGDPAQFRLRPRIFTWAPAAFVAAAVVGHAVSLTLVAVVAGLWNAEHTLMQRYGVTRIYGRKAGDDQGPLERAMLLSWLVLALVWVAADARTPSFLAKVDLGDTNAGGVGILHSLQPSARWLLVPLTAVVVALGAEWIRAEARRGREANPAKHLYVASTALLFVVMLVDPIAGLTGYIASHALEYFTIVHHTLGRRYRDRHDGGALGRAVRGPLGRSGFYAAYVGSVLALTLALRWRGSAFTYSVVYLTLGGMHVFYDGFIWKLRDPQVARGLEASPRATTGPLEGAGRRGAG